MGKDFMRMKFKANDDFPYNKKLMFQCVKWQ